MTEPLKLGKGELFFQSFPGSDYVPLGMASGIDYSSAVKEPEKEIHFTGFELPREVELIIYDFEPGPALRQLMQLMQRMQSNVVRARQRRGEQVFYHRRFGRSMKGK